MKVCDVFTVSGMLLPRRKCVYVIPAQPDAQRPNVWVTIMTNRKQMIRVQGMCAKLGGCSPSTIWRRVADRTLPKPTKIGGMTMWDESEVDAAIEAALAAR